MSLLTPGQRTFAGALARETGLNPRVVASWLLAEQSGGAARNYESRGYNNWLNIANTDSGPARGAHSSVWRDPTTAARATAEWLQGRGQIAHEYGKPAGGIMRILHSGSNPGAQISAIANSGWASSGYNGGADLRSLYSQLGGERIPAPSVTQGGQAHAATAGTPGYSEAPGTSSAQLADLAALMQGIQAQSSGAPARAPRIPQPSEVSAHPHAPTQPAQSGEEPQQNLLNLISQIGADAAPNIEHPGTPGTPGTEEAAGGGGGGYVNPVPGFKKGRTDQGVDYSATPGKAIRALGEGQVLGISPNWYQGQPYVYYRLTSGPQRGKVVFVAEQISPLVRPGQRVRAGQVIGRYAPSGTGIETGFGTPTGGQTLAKATTGYREGEETPAGKRFQRVLERVGAR